MAANRLTAVLRRLCERGAECAAGVPEDGQLLERFVQHRDEEAFGALVARHGPMVLDVCRRVLFDLTAAEDAFQATFLVLVRKAGSIRKGELLGNWLYGVAYRTASRAKVEAARRRARESTPHPTAVQPTDPLVDVTVREFMSALDDELSRLPARSRTPLVLCYLEGRTRDEAARELRCSLATLDRRLKAGRELLRSRLTARGLTMSGVLLGAVLCERAGTASVPAALMSAIIKLATGSAARTEVAALTEGVLQTMTVRIKPHLLLLAVGSAALLAAGAVGMISMANRTDAQPEHAAANPAPSARASEHESVRNESTERRVTDRLRGGTTDEPREVTLADGTVLKLETYGTEYEGYEYHPPMTPEGAEVLIDYAKLRRYGVGCGNLQLDLTHKKMYWVETGTTWGGNSIVCANLDGSGFRVVVDRHPLHPWNFAIDAKGGKIYWVNMGRRDDTGRSIERADLDGAHPKTIVPLVAVPSGIAIDPLDRKLYYFDDHDLMRSELDGGGEIRIAVDPSEGVRVPLLIEHQSKRIYWALGTWVIRGCGFDGKSVTNAIDVGEWHAEIRNIAMDIASQKIYWIERGTLGCIRRANMDGSQVETIVVGIEDPSGVAVDVQRQQLYWIEKHYPDKGTDPELRIRRARLPPVLKPRKFSAPPLVSGFQPANQRPSGEVTVVGRYLADTRRVTFIDDGTGAHVEAEIKNRSDGELSLLMPRMSERCRNPVVVIQTPGGLTAALPLNPVVLADRNVVQGAQRFTRFHPDGRFVYVARAGTFCVAERCAVLARRGGMTGAGAHGGSTFFLPNGSMGLLIYPRCTVYCEPFAILNGIDRPGEGSRFVVVPAIRPSFVKTPLRYEQPQLPRDDNR